MINLKRRSLLQTGALVLLLGRAQLASGASILAVRVWPANDYTRVTIESDTALVSKFIFVDQPPRLAVDIEGIELNPALRDLVGKVRSDDPFIIGVRVGQYAPNTVRLVLDLRQAVKPQVFNLPPVQSGQANIQHRLLLDLYPLNAVDPLEALIAEKLKDEHKPYSSQDAFDALIASHAGPSGNTHASPVTPPTTIKQPEPKASEPVISKPPSVMPPAPVEAGNSVASNPPAQINTPNIFNPATSPSPRPSARKAESEPVFERFAVVALDPGHGGEDPGAIGPGGTREKDVVLQIAYRLRERINKTVLKTRRGDLPLRAFMTRDSDFFLPLHVRVQKARQVQADLFISLHADAFITPQASGASVFALSQGAASSATARWMANKENAADAIGGLNLKVQDQHVQQALLDMSTTAQINDSLKLGTEMLGQIRRVGKLHKPQVEQAGFAVLKAPDIPSLLVETAFISNPQEENLLNSEAYQNQLADALMTGIENYFLRNPPMARNRSM